MPKCVKCGANFTNQVTKGGKPRMKCYTCSPQKRRLPVVIPEKIGLAEAKPDTLPEIPGATYTVLVTPWSKLRPHESHQFSSRNAAEDCAYKFRRFGERALVKINYPPDFQGGNSHVDVK